MSLNELFILRCILTSEVLGSKLSSCCTYSLKSWNLSLQDPSFLMLNLQKPQKISQHTLRAPGAHTHTWISIHAKLNTNTELYCCLWRSCLHGVMHIAHHMQYDVTSSFNLFVCCMYVQRVNHPLNHHQTMLYLLQPRSSYMYLQCIRDMYIYIHILPSLIYFERSSLFLCLYTSLIIVVLSRSTASLLCCLPRPCSHANLIHTASKHLPSLLPSRFFSTPQFSFNLKRIDFA